MDRLLVAAALGDGRDANALVDGGGVGDPTDQPGESCHPAKNPDDVGEVHVSASHFFEGSFDTHVR